jgi:hypothetical protein
MRLGAERLADMPQGYVRALFDQYAPKFESALVDDLGYRGPALLFKAVLAARAAVRKPPSSAGRSISAAAPGSPLRPLSGMSIISPASIFRRA